MTCNCELCKYNRAYELAVENNDKEFLTEHFRIFANVSMDEDWLRYKVSVLYDIIKKSNSLWTEVVESCKADSNEEFKKELLNKIRFIFEEKGIRGCL